MAIVSDGFRLTTTRVASNGRKVNRNYELTATNYADSVTDTTAILAAEGNVCAGTLLGYTISAKAKEDAFAGVPTDDDAEFGEYAVVAVQIEDDPFKTGTIRIPMPKIGLFAAATGVNRDVIDINDVALNAYVSLFQTGGQAYISDGEFADSIISGRRVK